MTQRRKDVNNNKNLIWTFSSVIFLLTSCGFHLRGDYTLPEQMANTYIKVANKNSELVRSLKRTLKASKINIVKSQQQASAILNISNDQQQKRVLSVDTQGRAREYEINYQLSFSMIDDGGKILIDEQTVKLQREFLFNAEDVLAKGREQETLIKDMQQDMVRLIMSRLQALEKNSIKE